jgi:transcriptional regulator with PAS, ATPase and Fis domain
VLVRFREADARVQLIVCARKPEVSAEAVVLPIHVPPLEERAAELPRIVDEYMLDAIRALKAPATTLGAADRAWMLAHAATTLPEIEKTALRLVALRTSDSVSAAASRLGMAAVSLSRWIERRAPPPRARRG